MSTGEEADQFRLLLDELFHSMPITADMPVGVPAILQNLSALTYKDGKQSCIDAAALRSPPPAGPSVGEGEIKALIDKHLRIKSWHTPDDCGSYYKLDGVPEFVAAVLAALPHPHEGGSK